MLISVPLFILMCLIIYDVLKKTALLQNAKSIKIFLIVLGLLLVIGGGIGLIVISEHQWDLIWEGTNPQTLSYIAYVAIILGVMIFIGGLLYSKNKIEKKIERKTITNSLEELEELKRKGLISIEDFEAKKQEILKRI